MKIQDTRRANLRRWLNDHSVPPAEKSYFSQLLGGSSFGERAARRLERDYGMGDGYLDEPVTDVTLQTRPVQAIDVEIPQYAGSGGSMGPGLVLRDQPGAIHGWRVTPEWVHKNIRNHTGLANLCIVTGFGNSMQPMYNPGDPLIVDRGIKLVESDATYFFRVGNEGFIKILQRIPGEGIRVISKNKDYETWTIKPDMDFEVFGQVLKVWCGVEV